jgi:hypothetical protein
MFNILHYLYVLCPKMLDIIRSKTTKLQLTANWHRLRDTIKSGDQQGSPLFRRNEGVCRIKALARSMNMEQNTK